MKLDTLINKNLFYYKYIDKSKTFKKEENIQQVSSYMQTKEIIEITLGLDEQNIQYKIDNNGNIVLDLLTIPC